MALHKCFECDREIKAEYIKKKIRCPYCGSKDTEVVETRDSEDLETIRRRRECLKC